MYKNESFQTLLESTLVFMGWAGPVGRLILVRCTSRLFYTCQLHVMATIAWNCSCFGLSLGLGLGVVAKPFIKRIA